MKIAVDIQGEIGGQSRVVVDVPRTAADLVGAVISVDAAGGTMLTPVKPDGEPDRFPHLSGRQVLALTRQTEAIASLATQLATACDALAKELNETVQEPTNWKPAIE